MILFNPTPLLVHLQEKKEASSIGDFSHCWRQFYAEYPRLTTLLVFSVAHFFKLAADLDLAWLVAVFGADFVGIPTHVGFMKIAELDPLFRIISAGLGDEAGEVIFALPVLLGCGDDGLWRFESAELLPLQAAADKIGEDSLRLLPESLWQSAIFWPKQVGVLWFAPLPGFDIIDVAQVIFEKE